MSEGGFLLKTLYSTQNNPAKALHYYSLANAAKDSVTSVEKTRQVQTLTFKEERRQQEIIAERLAYESRLKQDVLLGGLVLFSGIAFFLYRNNRQKQRLNNVLARQKTKIETLNNDLERKVEARTTELQNALYEVQTAFDKGQTTERKRVSADLHDEIGSALSTIAILSDLTKRKAQKTAPELMNELERIGVKSRDMIQTMRDPIWTLNENNSQSLWERMYLYSNEVLTAKGITFDWQVAMNGYPVSVAVKRNVLLAYKEALCLGCAQRRT
ncbi:MAG: histidine kinase [Cytophagaceae bacterium]|nr:histidine kinase [Cytophagaceae bacterium]